MTLAAHICRQKRVQNKARSKSAHRALDKALSDVGLPLRPHVLALHTQAVNKAIAERQAAVTEGLRATFGRPA